MKLPNILTFSRLAIIPVFIICFYLPGGGWRWLTAGLFIVSAVTDWIDGYLARYLQQVSDFGAFLDPVADKLIVAVSLVLLTGEMHAWYVTLPATVIVCREILISALREWMAELGKRVKVAVNRLAKIKTIIQMVAIAILLVVRGYSSCYVLYMLGCTTLYIAALMTLVSLGVYMNAAWSMLRTSKIDWY